MDELCQKRVDPAVVVAGVKVVGTPLQIIIEVGLTVGFAGMVRVSAVTAVRVADTHCGVVFVLIASA